MGDASQWPEPAVFRSRSVLNRWRPRGGNREAGEEDGRGTEAGDGVQEVV